MSRPFVRSLLYKDLARSLSTAELEECFASHSIERLLVNDGERSSALLGFDFSLLRVVQLSSVVLSLSTPSGSPSSSNVVKIRLVFVFDDEEAAKKINAVVNFFDWVFAELFAGFPPPSFSIRDISERETLQYMEVLKEWRRSGLDGASVSPSSVAVFRLGSALGDDSAWTNVCERLSSRRKRSSTASPEELRVNKSLSVLSRGGSRSGAFVKYSLSTPAWEYILRITNGRSYTSVKCPFHKSGRETRSSMVISRANPNADDSFGIETDENYVKSLMYRNGLCRRFKTTDEEDIISVMKRESALPEKLTLRDGYGNVYDSDAFPRIPVVLGRFYASCYACSHKCSVNDNFVKLLKSRIVL